MGSCLSISQKDNIFDVYSTYTNFYNDITHLIMEYTGCYQCQGVLQKPFKLNETGLLICEQCLHTKYIQSSEIQMRKYLCVKCRRVYGIPIPPFDNKYMSRFFSPYTCEACENITTYVWTSQKA